jgi:hypothetical protein
LLAADFVLAFFAARFDGARLRAGPTGGTNNGSDTRPSAASGM